MVRGLTATLFQLNKLKVTASVTLTDYTKNSENWYYRTHTSRGDYISWYPSASLKLKYVKDKETEYYTDEYSRTDQLYLTNKNIGSFKMDLKDFYSKFQRSDLYEYDETGAPKSLNKKKTDSVIIILDETGYVCALEPIVMPSPNGKYVPGVGMKINIKAQEVQFTVSEFESFYDLIQNINLYELGLNMLQTYLLMRLNGVDNSARVLTQQIPVKMPNLYKNMEVKDYGTP